MEYDQIGSSAPAQHRRQKRNHKHGGKMESGHGGGLAKFVQIAGLMAVVFVVAFDDHLKLHKGGAATKQSRTLEMALKPAGPPVPRVVQPASEVETVDFKLPKNAKAGQILHVLVPGQHDLQAIRVPVGAKAGMMLSVKVPIKAALEEEGSGAEHEGGAKPDDDIVEEVEEEAEVVEEDVVFTWTHFFLLIAFVGAGTVVMFYFFRGMTSGFGPLQVDPRKIVDHPCRFCDSKTAELAEQQMRRRRELGSEDTPENTPRASSEPVTPRGAAEGKKKEEKKEHHAKPAAAKAGTSAVREMGRAQGFTKQDVAPKGVAALQDEGAAIKQTVKDQPQGAVETTHDKELFGGSEASVDADFELTSQEVFAEVWERGKWLVLLMIFQSLASMVLAQFEDLIKQHVVIALFLTMLIGSGGNAGGQSVAKAIHEIAVRGRTSGDMTLALRAAKRSIAVALWLAVILAWTAWVRVWIFHGGMENSLAISSSCGVIVFSSIIIGSMLPYAMLALGMDEIHAGAVIQVAMDIYGVTVTCIVCWFIWG